MTDIERSLLDVKVYKRGDARAPHKHLLILYAIGRALNSAQRLIPYSDVDKDLRRLLLEFGPLERTFTQNIHFGAFKTMEFGA